MDVDVADIVVCEVIQLHCPGVDVELAGIVRFEVVQPGCLGVASSNHSIQISFQALSVLAT